MNPSGLDNSSLQFIIEKFNEKIIKNGHNQLNWISMERGKMGYMTRETRNSYSTNTSALQWWSSENSMMILWLVNIMLLMIGKTYLFLSMTREVWEDVREIYLMKKTFLKIFELKTWLWQTKQGDRKMIKYFMEMVAYLQKIDLCMFRGGMGVFWWQCLLPKEKGKINSIWVLG